MKNKCKILFNEQGMTLIEIVVVIIILSILAATVGPRIFKNVDKGKVSQARHQIGIFKGALDMYRLDTGALPTTQQGLKALVANPGTDGWDGPYLDNTAIPTDPWGSAYSYQTPGTGRDYDIVSLGKDKAPGGDSYEADITN